MHQGEAQDIRLSTDLKQWYTLKNLRILKKRETEKSRIKIGVKRRSES